MIHLKKSQDGQTFFIFKATNRRILVTSETYKRPGAALKSARALIRLTSGASPGRDHPAAAGKIFIDETKGGRGIKTNF